MILTRAAKMSMVFLGGLLFAVSAFGNEVEVVNRTDLFGQGKNKKPTKVGTANPGQRYRVISTKGAWTAINFNGKSVWIASKNVRPVDGAGGELGDSGEREPASWSGGGTSEGKYTLHADLGIQTGGVGFGPGIGGFYKVHKLSPQTRIDVGPSLFFFPSGDNGGITTTSVSAFEFMLNGRILHNIAPKMNIGGEAGLVFVSTSVSSTLTPGASLGGSNFGVNLGGTFTYEFAKQWNAIAAIRMVFAGGSSALISAGAEYTF